MDEESDDELPPISLSQDTSTREVVMPSAGEVAAEREREIHTERELQRLRAQDFPPPLEASAGGTGAPPPPRSDSTGSESEAALTAAVRALRMPRAAHAAHAPVARRLLALLPAPPQALQLYIAAFAEDASTTVRYKLISRMVHGVGCALSCEYNAWSEEALLTCCGALAAACLAAVPRPAPRRTLHRALARAPHARFVNTLAHTLAEAATSACAGPAGTAGTAGAADAAGALLALSDCARGGPPRAALLAALLVRRALALLLAPQQTQLLEEFQDASPLTAVELQDMLSGAGGAGRWRALAPPARLTALRLAARALAERGAGAGAGAEGAARARVLLTVAQPPQGADKQHPDYLKMAAAASTLQLLFH